MRYWLPDVCVGGQCYLQTSKGAGGDLTRVIQYCAHHGKLKNDSRSDNETYDVLIASMASRELARAAVKLHLGWDKERSNVSYRIEPDGSFTLGLRQIIETDMQGRPILDARGNKIKKWATVPDWPSAQDDKVKLHTAITEAVKDAPKPRGTSAVRLA